MHTTPHLINTPPPAPRNGSYENVAHMGSCVYAVLFSDGWLKVGRGRNGRARIGSHAGLSSMRNATVVSSVISGRLVDANSAETRLIEFCQQKGTQVHGREWFTGVSFEEISAIITSEFSGDDIEAFRSASRRSEASTKKLLADVDAAFGETNAKRAKAAEDSFKWATSITHARVMNGIYISDIYGGDLFAIQPWGLTKFETLAALALNDMDDIQIGEIYGAIFANPGEALEVITGAGEAIIEAYMAGRNA